MPRGICQHRLTSFLLFLWGFPPLFHRVKTKAAYEGSNVPRAAGMGGGNRRGVGFGNAAQDAMVDTIIDKLDNIDGISRMMGAEVDDQTRIIKDLTSYVPFCCAVALNQMILRVASHWRSVACYGGLLALILPRIFFLLRNQRHGSSGRPRRAKQESCDSYQVSESTQVAEPRLHSARLFSNAGGVGACPMFVGCTAIPASYSQRLSARSNCVRSPAFGCNVISATSFRLDDTSLINF